MKLALIFLAFLGIACGKTIPPAHDLHDDLQDFLDILPTDKILAVTADYLANDAEVQAAVEYLKSEEFETTVMTIHALPEFENFLNFLEEKSFHTVDFLLNGIHDLLVISHIPIAAHKEIRTGVRITGFIDDIVAILPIAELKVLFEEKLETNPDFKALYDAIYSPEFQKIVETLKAMPEYQELIQKLKDKGVDVAAIIDLIYQTFNLCKGNIWIRYMKCSEDPSFLALLPVYEILAICMDYINNDAEVQAAVEYLMSDEFETIVVAVDALPEFRNFLNFLEDLGLNAIYFLNNIHDMLEIPQIPFTARKHIHRGVGFSGLFDDIVAILPVEELKAYFEEMYETCPEFKAMYDAICSPEFQSIVETLKATPEYQEFFQKLKDNGLDFDKLIDLIHIILPFCCNEHH